MCSLNSDHLGPEGVVRVQRYLGAGVDQTIVRELRRVDGHHLEELQDCGEDVDKLYMPLRISSLRHSNHFRYQAHDD
jgi:hypothetical protein